MTAPFNNQEPSMSVDPWSGWKDARYQTLLEDGSFWTDDTVRYRRDAVKQSTTFQIAPEDLIACVKDCLVQFLPTSGNGSTSGDVYQSQPQLQLKSLDLDEDFPVAQSRLVSNPITVSLTKEMVLIPGGVREGKGPLEPRSVSSGFKDDVGTWCHLPATLRLECTLETAMDDAPDVLYDMLSDHQSKALKELNFNTSEDAGKGMWLHEEDGSLVPTKEVWVRLASDFPLSSKTLQGLEDSTLLSPTHPLWKVGLFAHEGDGSENRCLANLRVWMMELSQASLVPDRRIDKNWSPIVHDFYWSGPAAASSSAEGETVLQRVALTIHPVITEICD